MQEQHAKAYILVLIGSALILDTSVSHVHLMYLLLLSDLNNISNYNWALIILVFLYCALHYEIDFNQDNIEGCMLLLQLWAWDHVTCISPHVKPLNDANIDKGLGFSLVKKLFFFHIL